MRYVLTVLVGNLILASILWVGVSRFYQYDVFASKEARESVRVTDEQMQELLDSRLKADMIVYAVIGAVLVATAGCCSASPAHQPSRATGLITGMLLGAVGGAASGYLGNQHDLNVNFPTDPMLYWIARWAIIYTPIGLAAGVAVASSLRWKNVTDSVAAALVGVGASVVIYCLLSGTITPNESHERVLPGQNSNRLLMLLTAFGVIPTVLAWNTERFKKSPALADQVSDQSAETTSEADPPPSTTEAEGQA
ncbi:MAG: hypothetical protein KatS3mg111_0682 [Pirellulaceae bacterium]|nr:MAG: hypothetical protein KatS3mg111_0682 [Pirellulaceae bacterium]